MAKTSPYKPGMPWVSVAALVFLVLIVVGASVFESTRLRTDGPMMAVTANGNMFSVFGNDTVNIPVAKGDSVKMLGVHGDGIFMDYLVETPAGVRGWIKPWYVDIPVLTHSKKVNPGDTIRLTNIPKTESKYGHILGWEFFGTLADGSKSGNIYPTDYFPAFKDSHKFILRKHSSSHFASREKFERTVVGKNIEAVEKKYGPILQNFPTDSARKVTLNTSVFDKNSGQFYQPILTVAPDSTVSVVSLGLSTDRNSWIWKYLPLSSQLIDLPLTSFLARGDLYDSLKPSEFCDSALEKTCNWIKRIAIGIGGLLWLFAVPSAVVLFFYILLYFRHVLYPLSDTAVKILIAVVTVLFAYYWIIMTMTWGEYVFWEILLIATTYIICQAMFIPLADEIPPRHGGYGACRQGFPRKRRENGRHLHFASAGFAHPPLADLDSGDEREFLMARECEEPLRKRHRLAPRPLQGESALRPLYAPLSMSVLRPQRAQTRLCARCA